jgi:hypothetical protein
MKSVLTTVALAAMALVCVTVALPVHIAVAQDSQRLSFTVPAKDAVYAQQHIINVPDPPGHQIRVVEIHRIFPSNPPVINGIALKELSVRAITDYVNENGRGSTYSEYVFENGDKFFAQATLIAHGTGSGILQANTIGEITRGTGKLAGIEGHIFTTTFARPIAGNVETTFEIDYTIKRTD